MDERDLKIEKQKLKIEKQKKKKKKLKSDLSMHTEPSKINTFIEIFENPKQIFATKIRQIHMF